MIDEDDANCGLHGATFELEGNETKARIRRSTDEDHKRRLRQGIRNRYFP